MNNIQEEVRNLHFQLKQKDTIINKLTKLIVKKGEDDDEYGSQYDVNLGQTGFTQNGGNELAKKRKKKKKKKKKKPAEYEDPST